MTVGSAPPDGGTIGDGGDLTITDGKRDVIICGGECQLHRVEDVLFIRPAVAEAAVLAVQDEKRGRNRYPLVVLRDGEPVSEIDQSAEEGHRLR